MSALTNENSLLIEFLSEELPPINLVDNIGCAFSQAVYAQLNGFVSATSQLRTFIAPRRFGCVIDGIKIPTSKIEVVFVPLLAFDKKGNRVGYGKGFYDRFLSECNPETIKIGLSFFEPEELIEDVFENDVKLDYCVTPDEVYQF